MGSFVLAELIAIEFISTFEYEPDIIFELQFTKFLMFL